MKRLMVILVIGFTIVGYNANAQIQTNISTENDSLIRAMCADVSQDSIRTVMQELQNFGTRFYRAPGYRNVAQWIKNKLIAVGCENTVLDSFWLTNSAFSGWQYNVIGTLNGTENPDSIYILGAHHDCTSDYANRLTNAPGADDNASGVAGVIEAARVMFNHHYRPKSTIQFMTFTAEEIGLVGSDTLARRARSRNQRVQMMLNNDMISYCADTVNQWKVKLTYYNNSADVTNLADTCTRRYTTLGTTRTTQYNDASDSYSFYQQGYKTLFFIENYDTPYYHTTNDRVETCNMKFAAEMTRIPLSMLVSQNGSAVMVNVEDNPLMTTRFILYPNYPNPFNPSTTIRYQLATDDRVSLKIYNTLGQEIRTLVSGRKEAGVHDVTWNGRDHAGHIVASGVYIYRLQAGSQVKSGKMILTK